MAGSDYTDIVARLTDRFTVANRLPPRFFLDARLHNGEERDGTEKIRTCYQRSWDSLLRPSSGRSQKKSVNSVAPGAEAYRP